MFQSLNSFLFLYLKCTCTFTFDWTYRFSLRWSCNYILHIVFDWVSIQIGYWQLMRSLSVQTLVFCDLCCFLSLYMYDWKAIGEEIKLLAIPTKFLDDSATQVWKWEKLKIYNSFLHCNFLCCFNENIIKPNMFEILLKYSILIISNSRINFHFIY